MTPTDLKQYGCEPEPMPTGLKRVCQVLITVAVLGTAYGLVADEADKVVVMKRSTFEQTVAQERIKAAREVMEATECRGNWRDQFLEPKQMKKWSRT